MGGKGGEKVGNGDKRTKFDRNKKKGGFSFKNGL